MIRDGAPDMTGQENIQINDLINVQDFKIPGDIIKSFFGSDRCIVSIEFTTEFMHRMNLYINSSTEIKIILDRYYVRCERGKLPLTVRQVSSDNPKPEFHQDTHELDTIENPETIAHFAWIRNKTTEKKMKRKIGYNLANALRVRNLKIIDVFQAFSDTEYGMKQSDSIYHVRQGKYSLTLESCAVLYDKFGITPEELLEGVTKPRSHIDKGIQDTINAVVLHAEGANDDLKEWIHGSLKYYKELLDKNEAEFADELLKQMAAAMNPKSLADLIQKVNDTPKITADKILGHWTQIERMIKKAEKRKG